MRARSASLDGIGGALLLGGARRCSSPGASAPSRCTPAGDEARKLREAVQRSAILAALNDAHAPFGAAAQRAAPGRPDARRPRARRRRRARPTPASADDPEVARRRQLDACASSAPPAGSASQGSGWVARARTWWSPTPTSSPARTTPPSALDGGPELDATAVHYDPRNDLALLEVPGLDAPALELAERPRKGDRRRGDRLSRERAADLRRRRGSGAPGVVTQPGLLRSRPGPAAR